MATTQKRKRGSLDHDSGRLPPGYGRGPESSPGQEAPTADMEGYPGVVDNNAINQLIAHNNNQHSNNGNASDHGLHQNGGNPQSATDTAAAALQYDIGAPPSGDMPYGNPPVPGDQNSFLGDQSFGDLNSQQQSQSGPNKSPIISGSKPPVGSEEWHKVRRDNHKEVERRRRETINEGINELAKIVPGCEKNKGSILQRAVQYITQLKDNENTNIEKWTLEKLLLEQALSELTASCERLQKDCELAYREVEATKQAAARQGVKLEGVDGERREQVEGEA